MAAKETKWDINVDGVPYHIVLKKNKVIVNNETPIKLNKLRKSGNPLAETNYYIPLGEKDAILHARAMGGVTLSFDGKDCSTGEEYVPLKASAWVWIFVVLHALNFFLLIGGAVGGAIQGLVLCIMVSISANTKKSTAVRVAICAGIWLVSTILQAILASFLVSALYPTN